MNIFQLFPFKYYGIIFVGIKIENQLLNLMKNCFVKIHFKIRFLGRLNQSTRFIQ